MKKFSAFAAIFLQLVNDAIVAWRHDWSLIAQKGIHICGELN